MRQWLVSHVNKLIHLPKLRLFASKNVAQVFVHTIARIMFECTCIFAQNNIC